MGRGGVPLPWGRATPTTDRLSMDHVPAEVRWPALPVRGGTVGPVDWPMACRTLGRGQARTLWAALARPPHGGSEGEPAVDCRPWWGRSRACCSRGICRGASCVGCVANLQVNCGGRARPWGGVKGRRDGATVPPSDEAMGYFCVETDRPCCGGTGGPGGVRGPCGMTPDWGPGAAWPPRRTGQHDNHHQGLQCSVWGRGRSGGPCPWVLRGSRGRGAAAGSPRGP